MERWKNLRIILTFVLLVITIFSGFLGNFVSAFDGDVIYHNPTHLEGYDWKEIVLEKVGKIMGDYPPDCLGLEGDTEYKQIGDTVYVPKLEARFVVIKGMDDSLGCAGVHGDSPIIVFRIDKDGRITRIFYSWTQAASLYLSPSEDKLIINTNSTALCYGGSYIYIYKINESGSDLIAKPPESSLFQEMAHNHHTFKQWLDNDIISYEEAAYDTCYGEEEKSQPLKVKELRVQEDPLLTAKCENGLRKYIPKVLDGLSFCYDDNWNIQDYIGEPYVLEGEYFTNYSGELRISSPKKQIRLIPERVGYTGVINSVVCTVGLGETNTLDNGLSSVPFDKVYFLRKKTDNELEDWLNYSHTEYDKSLVNQASFILEIENNKIQKLHSNKETSFSSSLKNKVEKCFSKDYTPESKSITIPVKEGSTVGSLVGEIVDKVEVTLDDGEDEETREIVNSICWTVENCEARDERQRKEIEKEYSQFLDEDTNNDYFDDLFDCNKFFENESLIPENQAIKNICFGVDTEEGSLEQNLNATDIKKQVEDNSDGLMKEVWKNTSEDVFICVLDTTGIKENKNWLDHTAEVIDFGIEAIPLLGNLYQIGKGWSGKGITGDQSCVDRWANNVFGLGGLAWSTGKGIAGCSAGASVAVLAGCAGGGLVGVATGKVEEKVAKSAIKQTLKKGGKGVLTDLGSSAIIKLVKNTLKEGVQAKVFVEVVDGAATLLLNREDKNTLHELPDIENISKDDIEFATNKSFPNFGIEAKALDLDKYNSIRRAFRISVKNGKTFVVKIPTRISRLSKTQKEAIEKLTKLVNNKEVGQSYDSLAKATAGWRGCKSGGCFQVHHLLEVRMVIKLRDFFKINRADVNTKIPCLIMTQADHIEITQYLRKLIPLGRGYENISTASQAAAYYEAAYKKAGLQDEYIKHVKPLFKDFDKTSSEYSQYFEEATQLLNQ